MASISNIFIDQGATFTTTVTVTDANGCNVNYSVLIEEPSELGIFRTLNHPSCYNYSDGSIDLDYIPAGIPKKRIKLQIPGLMRLSRLAENKP